MHGADVCAPEQKAAPKHADVTVALSYRNLSVPKIWCVIVEFSSRPLWAAGLLSNQRLA